MHVIVYGAYHSPWVQAVLAALHDRDISHTTTALPPLDTFLTDGVTMPAARINNGPWQLESTDILRQLDCAEVTSEELQHINSAWRGVLHRTDSIGFFWGGFSLAGDGDPNPVARLIKNFLRSFVTLYFYLLIRSVNLFSNPRDPDNFGDQFVYFNDRLAATGEGYLCGEEPDTLDYLLFGILQCHASIYVPPITALQSDERLNCLRKWIACMHERMQAYPYLYSGLYFEPYRPPPVPDQFQDRLAFWLGAMVMISLAPITVPLVAFLAFRRRSAS